jgi:cysteine desulfurase
MARRIYMDYASTTPLDRRVFKAMQPYLMSDFGNPSALYKEGMLAKKAVQDARKTISELLNVRSEEIFFTASGTESDNLALRGAYEYWKNIFAEKKFTPHIITTNIERPGILETAKWIERNGGEVTYVAVEENGIVNPEKIRKALKETTVLVTVMLANNEIGTIQPLRDISRVIAEYKKEKIEDDPRCIQNLRPNRSRYSRKALVCTTHSDHLRRCPGKRLASRD